jgi:Mg2+-importing ATPase
MIPNSRWNTAARFRTSWFVESVFTQTLALQIICTNKIPFFQSQASRPLISAPFIIVSAVG